MSASTPTPAPMLIVPLTDETAEQLADLLAPRLLARLPATDAAKAVSTPGLAEALNCSRAKIHKLAERGDLPFFWLGDERRFYVHECVEALRKLGRVASK
jgi:hypothetical protein